VRRVQLVLLLGLLTAFGPIAVDMYLPALPQLTHELDIGASAAQLTLASCLAGVAIGQLVSGPLSDRFGRRAPLLVGVAIFVAASLACAAAPTAAALIALRFIQGLGAGAGIAIARAVARDLTTGDALARFLSLLMLMNGLAPILAPVIGAQLLRVTSWHGIFVVLAAIGAVALLGVIFVLHETLPPDERQPGGFADVRATTKELLGDHAFVGYLLVLAFSTGAMFAYIAGSSFVIEDIHGGSPQLYGAIFALNGIGIVGASQLNRRLLRRHSALTLLGAGVVASACGGFALLAVVVAGIGLAGIIPSFFVLVASIGMIIPNATALALAPHARVAGSASGLIGIFQFTVGALAAPLVGVAGTDSAYPMAIVIALLGGASLVALRRVQNVPVNAESP
jgi:MFS transporter, DHA1 family, multidrug resistance protein